MIVKFDMSAGSQQVKTMVFRRDKADAICMWRDGNQIERPLIGEGSFAYELDRPERLKNGAPYFGGYRTPPFDFGTT